MPKAACMASDSDSDVAAPALNGRLGGGRADVDALAGTTVLVIDDDPFIREFTARCLERAGCRVVLAKDGVGGMAAVSDDVQVVITDIFMPEQDGLEVVKAVRRCHPQVRVLAISGGRPVFDQDFLRFAAALGADATLAKPFTPKCLVSAVRRIVEDSRTSSAAAAG